MLPSLNDLVAKVRGRIEQDDKLKEAKKAVKEARGKEEVQQANLAARKIQDDMDWKAVAIIQKIDVWQCRCGVSGEAPSLEGLLVYYEHTRHPDASRMVSPGNEGTTPPDLPRRFIRSTRISVLCPSCGPSFGFAESFERRKRDYGA